ncbi:carbohydrate sulfotransferase 11 [Delphinus delphis]|uniref:Carbohydrate sulfotransferase n=3 Tax=Odontoceti TaxID=9722 RepID=A0A6J3S593_TURTR|nr:carbohydrate sulfotransferase 11 isoform X1 [Tursiops truncatus]XP_059879881.1 carbohydrate sulfotransferase 11 [Delphinus delphis]
MQFCSCGKSLTCASHFPRLPLAGGAPPHPTPSDSANVISGRFPQHLKTVRPRALPSFLPSATLEVGRGRCVPGAPAGAPCVLYAVWIARSSLWTLVMRRSPFGVDICCRKGSRSPLQELYNPTQRSLERVSPPWLELSNTAVLHQMRRDQVTDTCRANSAVSRKRRVLTPNDLKHLVVDEDHELIYCYVPKVACTNWKRLMMVLTGRGKYSDPMEIPANEAHVSANLKTLNQYSIPEINHRLKSYMKFLFVREPFERLVSAYRNKFTQKYNTSFHKRYGTKIIRRQRKNATQEALRKGDDVKFEEFVAYLIDPHTQREEPFNEHWQTVYSLCHPCHIHYDLVGKYETLEEDSNYVLQLAGVGSYLKFPTYAKSTRTTDEMTTEFFQNISSEHQTQLYEVYKLDFLMFNYSVPSYLKLE